MKISRFLFIFVLLSSITFASSKTFNNNSGLGDGMWNTASNWTGGTLPSAGDIVVIPSGVTCTFNIASGGGYDASNALKGLIVQSGATLKAAGSTQYNLFIGDGSAMAITCDGTIGDAASQNGIAIVLVNDGGFGSTLSGTGTFAPLFLAHTGSASTDNVILTIDMNATLTRSGTALWNAASDQNSEFDVIINSGKTVSVPNGSVSIDGINGATGATDGSGGTIAISGKLDVANYVYVTTDGTGLPVQFTVQNGGVLTCKNLITTSSGSATANLNVLSNGTLNFTGTGSVWGAEGSNVNLTINSGATIGYIAAGAQTIEDIGTSGANLILGGSGTKTLPGGGYTLSANSDLTLTDPVTISGTLNYGLNSVLYYSGTSDYTTSFVEFPSTMSNSVVISTTGTVTINGAKTIYNNLTVSSGSTFNLSDSFVIVSGDFTNNGSVTNGYSNVGLVLTRNGKDWNGAGTIDKIEIDPGSGNTITHVGSNTVNKYLNIGGGTFKNLTSLTFADGAKIYMTNSKGLINNTGSFKYNGTIDVQYKAGITTSDELPTSSSALNNLIIDFPVTVSSGFNPVVNGTLTLNSNLDIGTNNSTITICNPIAGTLSKLDPGSNKGSLTISGSANNITIPDAGYNNITINNSNGASLSGDNSSVKTLTFNSGAGNLETSANTLTIDSTISNESYDHYILGKVKMTGSPFSGGMGLTPSTNITGTGLSILRETGNGTAVSVGSDQSINRVYTISTSSNDLSFTGTVSIEWFENDRNNKNMSNVSVYDYYGTTSEWSNRGPGTTANQPSTGKYTITSSSNTTTPSNENSLEITVTDNSNPLPVELTTFNATVEGNNVKLDWETSTEVNNYGFDIQKRTKQGNNTNWEKIGFLKGSGNSNSPESYNFIDKDVQPGKYLYRLKQTDINGNYNFSKIIDIYVKDIPGYTELDQNYPNPFNPETVIRFNIPKSEFVSLKIYDELGNEIETLINKKMQSGNHNIRFDGGKLASGIYFYTLKAQNFSESRKMILLK